MFTNEIARNYRHLGKNIFCISDIRTADWKKNRDDVFALEYNIDIRNGELASDDIKIEGFAKSSQITENEVRSDMKLQESWIFEMNPEHAFLKFRLPWPTSKQDSFVPYLNGTVYIQSWAPHTSTETRLKPTRNAYGEYELKQWNIREYEEQCFYHNVIVREKIHYKDIFTNCENIYPDYPELVNDYDSTAEAYILYMYLKTKTNENFSSKEVSQLSHKLTKHLNHDNMLSSNVITLNILRASPFKASGRDVSKRRSDWFKQNPGVWKQCKRFL